MREADGKIEKKENKHQQPTGGLAQWRVLPV